MRISDWSSDVCFFRSFILPHHPAHPPRPERRDDDAAEHRLAFARNAIVERAEGGGQKKDAGAGHGWRGYRRERIIGKRPFVAPSPPRRGSEESRGGKEGVSTCRTRGSRSH